MELKNIQDYRLKAAEVLTVDNHGYLDGAAEDLRTCHRNKSIFENVRIRPRQLVDVSQIDTKITLFGREYASPVFLCPVAIQRMFHTEAEIGAAKAAAAKGNMMVVSTFSSYNIGEVAEHCTQPPWFQLYANPDRKITHMLLEKAEAAGCENVVLTTDTPVLGNREFHGSLLSARLQRGDDLGNFKGIDSGKFDETLTWDFIAWLRDHCRMRIVLKGIQTAEDAELALKYGVDGIIVSNHGGRQLETDRSTLECLTEVAGVTQGRIPVLIDSGITRGTDVLKCLALGASAVGIGRAYIYGLAVDGENGVREVLDIFQTELVRNMKLAGTVRIADITRDRVIF